MNNLINQIPTIRVSFDDLVLVTFVMHSRRHQGEQPGAIDPDSGELYPVREINGRLSKKSIVPIVELDERNRDILAQGGVVHTSDTWGTQVDVRLRYMDQAIDGRPVFRERTVFIEKPVVRERTVFVDRPAPAPRAVVVREQASDPRVEVAAAVAKFAIRMALKR